MEILEQVQEHAETYWRVSHNLSAQFDISKIDVAQDFLGSYLPKEKVILDRRILDLTQYAIDRIFMRS